MEINARNGTEQKEIEMERRLHERVGERDSYTSLHLIYS